MLACSNLNLDFNTCQKKGTFSITVGAAESTRQMLISKICINVRDQI
jgi:hypothetical protein